jgi:AcrR family transcriptional regulator
MSDKHFKPKQTRSQKSMQSIFDAARQVFARKGFAGARIEEIANNSGANKQRIYAYFGSKAELYRRVLLDVYTQAAHQEKIMSLTEADIPHLTYKLVSAFIEFHHSHPEFWKLLSWENISQAHSLKDTEWSQIRGSYIDHVEKLFCAGCRNGIFKTDTDFSSYIMTIFAVTYFYYSNRLTISQLLNIESDTELNRKAFAEQIAKLIDGGLKV